MECKDPSTMSVEHTGEHKYSGLEKLALALISAARCLRHYFQSHNIVVVTDQPIKGSWESRTYPGGGGGGGGLL